MPSPLNAALVGFGFAGQTFHAPLISACPDLRLHTVVTSNPEALAASWPQARPVATLDDAKQIADCRDRGQPSLRS